MNSMNDQHLFDLAMKVIASQGTEAERAELQSAMAAEPRLRAEFERLRAEARIAKEVLPLVNATESTAVEFPDFARERLQTKVRQTLGRRQISGEHEREKKMMWKWWWILGLATGAAAVVFLLLPGFKRTAGPVVQIAMLDTIGPVR